MYTAALQQFNRRMGGLREAIDTDPNNPAKHVKTFQNIAALLGFEAGGEIFIDLADVLSESLTNIKDEVLASQLGQELVRLTDASQAKIKELFELLQNPEYLKPRQFPLDILDNYIRELAELNQRWYEVQVAVSTPAKRIVERIEEAVSQSTQTRLDKLEVTTGKKVIIDVNTATAAKEMEVSKANAAEYKAYLIATAKSLANKDYNWEIMRQLEVKAVVKAMKLSGSDADIFWTAYRRTLNKMAPSTLVETTKEVVASKYTQAKDYVKARAASTAGQILSNVDLFTSRPVYYAGRKLRIIKKKDRDTGIFRALGQYVGAQMQRFEDLLGTAKTTIKGYRVVQAAGKVASGTAGVVGNTVKVVSSGTAFIGGAAKGGAGAAALLVLTGVGLSNPVGQAIILSSAAVTGGAQAFQTLKGLKAFELAVQNRRALQVLDRTTKYINPASNGALVGGLIGTVVGGPIGAVIGAGVGASAGVGVKYAGQLAQSRIMAGRAFGTATKVPLGAVATQVQSNLWTQTMIEMGLADTGINKVMANVLEFFGSNKAAENLRNMQVSETDRQFYDLRRISARNPVPLVMNALNLYMFSANRNLLFSPVTLYNFSRWLGITRLFPGFAARLELGIEGPRTYLATRAGVALSRGAAVGGFVGTALGIIIASALGFNIGIGAAIGGAIGTVVGGLAALGVAGTTWGSGALASGAIVAGTTALGTVIGAGIETKFFSKMPKFINPLSVLQGLVDIMRWFNTPIRTLSDYGTIAIIAIGIINFLILIMQFNGSAPTQNSKTKEEANTSIIFNTQTTAYSENYQTLEINKAVLGTYSFQNVERVETLNDNKLALIEGRNYWVINNPGKYLYNPQTKTLAGKGQDLAVNVYTKLQPENLAVAGNGQPSSNEAFQAINFCQLFLDLCPSN